MLLPGVGPGGGGAEQQGEGVLAVGDQVAGTKALYISIHGDYPARPGEGAGLHVVDYQEGRAVSRIADQEEEEERDSVEQL